MAELIDFGPYHRLVAEVFFDGQAWIYNGCVCFKENKAGEKQLHYICRVRDMRQGQYSQSHMLHQVFDRHTFELMGYPRLLPIITADNRRLQMDTGPQDPRIFVHKSNLWAVFNMMCADGYRRMHLYCVSGTSGGGARPLKINGADRTKVEKNWTPFVFNGELFFIYSFVPFVVLHVVKEYSDAAVKNDSGYWDCNVVFAKRVGADNLPQNRSYRGGSPATVTTTDRHTYQGWLHTTKPTRSYDLNVLPTPARKTAHEYRAARFTFVWGKTFEEPKLTIEEETVFFGKQIEQVYGVLEDDDHNSWLLINVNDKNVVLKKKNDLNLKLG